MSGDRRTPAHGSRRPVPYEFLDDDGSELTPVRAIVRLGEKLEDHKDDDARAIAGVHESIKALDTRLTSQISGLDIRVSQKIADVGSIQAKLLTETSGQTVMLQSAMDSWDNDRRARTESAARLAAEARDAAEKERKAAEKERKAALEERQLAQKAAEAKMDRRTKVLLAVVGIVATIVSGLVVHAVERGGKHSAVHEPAEP